MNLSSELKDFVEKHENEDIHFLALQTKKYPDIDLQMAIRQIKGRKIASEKIQSWHSNTSIIYPQHISLEQCSSEQTARYKASLTKGNSMTDLTGGFGVDFSFLAKNFKEATYVEQQSELVEIAAHNFQKLGLDNVSVENADAVEYLNSMSPVDLIYIDPARRDTVGRKTVRIEDCAPNILDIEDLLEAKAGQTMIKLSPMLDISLSAKSMRDIAEVHIISSNNECKELLFLKNKSGNKLRYYCVNILKDRTEKFSFDKEQEEQAIIDYTSYPGKYLYEPNASLLKAGAYKYTAIAFCLKKLHPSSHLYTSDEFRPDFQGRKFIVENVCSLNKKDIKQYLPDIKQANITTRNFPLSADEVRKKAGLKDGGDIYIFATTLADDKKVLIICRKA